jgi:hypothetical protein
MNNPKLPALLLDLVRGYQQATEVLHQSMKEKFGPHSNEALLMEARADTAKTLADEIEFEIRMDQMGIAATRAEMPTPVTRMMYPKGGH